MLREIVFQDTNIGKIVDYLCHFPAGLPEPHHCPDWTCPRPLPLKESLLLLD
jgi:hypothetical protein